MAETEIQAVAQDVLNGLDTIRDSEPLPDDMALDELIVTLDAISRGDA